MATFTTHHLPYILLNLKIYKILIQKKAKDSSVFWHKKALAGLFARAFFKNVVIGLFFIKPQLSLRASATSEAICQALAVVIARHEATFFLAENSVIT